MSFWGAATHMTQIGRKIKLKCFSYWCAHFDNLPMSLEPLIPMEKPVGCNYFGGIVLNISAHPGEERSIFALANIELPD